MGLGGQRHAPAALPWERPGTHCIGGRMPPPLVWKGKETLTSTGIRSPDRPARSESLYRLHYPSPRVKTAATKIICNKKTRIFFVHVPMYSLPHAYIPVIYTVFSQLSLILNSWADRVQSTWRV